MTFGTGVLQVGSTGGGVTELQGWLAARGFLTAAPTASGTFDAATDQAVKAFQLSAGIACDGQVGDGTRTAADAFTGTALSGGWHPGAVRDVQQTSIGGSFTTTTRRGVLHTTEGSSLPAYPNPPHFTVGRSGGLAAQIWQHYPVTVASRALANVPGPPETNRFGAVQIEIIGFAAASAGLATSEPDTFRTLGELMRWIETNAGVANSTSVTFAGEAAYGLAGSVRLDTAGWEASTGWLGHQHVPENSHWDPGLIDIAALLAVPAAASPAPAPSLTQATGSEPRPSVRATTRALSNAFPSLTLAIDPAGLPWFEILLATSPDLFLPDQAAHRDAGTFYASRQDGLSRSADAYGRWIAPVGVVAALAAAHPDGGRVYYTVIGYADERGGGAVPAATPELLAFAAASVPMLPGFSGHTRTDALGVPLGMLALAARTTAVRATGVDGGRLYGTPRTRQLSGVAAAPDPVASDRMEGEDGVDVRSSLADPAPAFVPIVPSAAPAPVFPAAAPPVPPPPAPSAGAASAALPASPDEAPATASGWSADPAGTDTYEDGWERWDSEGPRNLSDGESDPAPADEFDDLGGATPQPAPPGDPGVLYRPPMPELAPETKRAIVETYVGADTDLYAMLGADVEFTGGAGTDHPAYQRYHVGLTFGIVAFRQDDGDVGELAVLMQHRDPARFGDIFGADAAELLDVTNRPGPLGRDVPGGRSVRVQPVAGADLWTEPWLSRFRAAGDHPPFRGAQIELASGLYLDPVLRFAADLGLATHRGLAIVFDRSAHRGPVGGMTWVVETVGPLQTLGLRDAALAALGMSGVEEFQRSQPDLLVDDQFGPLTHAALAGILRVRAGHGIPSPVPLMDYAQLIEALGRRATGQPWGDRIVRLVSDATVSDSPKSLRVA